MRYAAPIVLATVIASLSGCATAPEVRPALASLPPLEPGMARLYASAEKMGGVKLWSVHQVGPFYLDGKQVGTDSKGEHFVLDIKPGTYESHCEPTEPDKNFAEKLQVTFSPNETHYLACDMARKGGGMYFGLVGALASKYLTKTLLEEKPLEPNSRLVAYTKL